MGTIRVGSLGARLAALLAAFLAGPANALTYADGPKLVGSAGVGSSFQGFSVALSYDGATAIIGGHEDAAFTGAAWIFTRSAGAWRQQGGKLVGFGAAGTATQGQSVAISAAGDTVIIGGGGDNSSAGAAWIFTRAGGFWTQQGTKLVGSGAVGAARQGGAVALSGDGNTALVGGIWDNSNVGAVWVFTQSQGTWTQQGPKLVGTGSVGNSFQSTSLALSYDGNTALVGASDDAAGAGAAWVFTRSAGVWTQQGAKLTGGGETGFGKFGLSVALSADGGTALIGGASDDANTGATWVFTRSGGVWSQQGSKLIGAGAVNAAEQGTVALSADGNTAAIGGNDDDSSKGAVWIFTRSGGIWTQRGGKLIGQGAVFNARMGGAVAISGDGSTVLAGGSQDNTQKGASWVFTRQCTGGDVNGSGAVDVGDVFYLINFLFAGGAAPAACF